MTKALKIFVGYDQPMFLTWLRMTLAPKTNIELIDYSRDGKESIVGIQKFKPELSILHYRLSLINGLEVAREVLSLNPDERIILISDFNDRKLVEEARSIGVQGFILNEYDEKEFHYAIEKVMKGEGYFFTDHLENRN